METPNPLDPLRDSMLTGGNPYLVPADFESYCNAQNRIDAAFRDRESWARSALLNISRMRRFSSDRTVREYVKGIWNFEPVPV